MEPAIADSRGWSMSDPRETVPVSKRLGSAAAIFLLSWGVWTTNELSDPVHGISRDALHLVGNVGIVVVQEATMFQSSSDPVEGARFPVESMTFGEDGLLRQWVQYAGPQGPAVAHEYTYADGVLVQEDVYGAPEKMVEQTVYTHEEGGRRTTAEVRSGGKVLRKTVIYERDADGKLVTVTEYTATGALISKVAYTYSPKEERADRTDAEGKLLSWSIKTYNAAGQSAAVSLYSQGAEDSPFTTTYEYDARGNVTLEETSGQLTLGFIVLTLPTSATKISYEYTYDSTGNWEKRVKSAWVPDKDNPHWQATSVRYRTIRYYE
jgi:hypothetical protein